MALKLAENETIIKRWNYGTIKTSMTQKTKAELIITNKRVIDFKDAKNSCEIIEAPVKDVETISFYSAQSSFFKKFLAVLEIIIGVPFILLLGLGLKMIRAGVAVIRGGDFTLELLKDGHVSDLVEIGMHRGVVSKNANKIRVTINKAVVKEIGEEIGSILLGSRA